MNSDNQEIQPSLSPSSPTKETSNKGQLAEQFRLPVTEAQTVKALERGSPSAPGSAPAVQATQPTDDSAAAAISPATGTTTGTATSIATPQIADDLDLIEKEWVDKAKQIVEQTAHDPYLQNKEIIKVKVDYLKKRYNKDLKVSDD